VVCSTLPSDIVLGSCGYLLPGFEARLVSHDGKEITEYNTRGELVVRSLSVVLGYLNNEKASKETFRDRWLHTGDEAEIRLSPKTNFEHIWIVDRIKELIKVKVSLWLPFHFSIFFLFFHGLSVSRSKCVHRHANDTFLRD
jgi:long-subunit acyl-CoA synthetase (AMP-forming)